MPRTSKPLKPVTASTLARSEAREGAALPVCACGGKWMAEYYYLHTDACTNERRGAWLRKLRRIGRMPGIMTDCLMPGIMTDCPECNGSGRVEATCENCGVKLTELNAAPGSDTCCAKCEREDA